MLVKSVEEKLNERGVELHLRANELIKERFDKQGGHPLGESAIYHICDSIYEGTGFEYLLCYTTMGQPPQAVTTTYAGDVSESLQQNSSNL